MVMKSLLVIFSCYAVSKRLTYFGKCSFLGYFVFVSNYLAESQILRVVKVLLPSVLGVETISLQNIYEILEY